MREAWRALRTVCGFALRADPLRAIGGLFLEVGRSAAFPLFSYLLKVIVDGAIQDDLRAIVWAGIGIGAGFFVLLLSGLFSQRMQLRLQEKTGFLMDIRIMELTGGAIGLEHHERPEYLDEVELLRIQRFNLAQTFPSLVANLGALAQLGGTLALLGQVHPVILLLPLAGLPSMGAAGISERMRQNMLTATAEQTRLSRHLFEISTAAGPAKEIRVFGLAGELRRRHDRLWAAVVGEQDKVLVKSSLLMVGGWAIFAATFLGCVLLVLREAIEGRASVGDVVLTLTLGQQVNGQVQAVAHLITWMFENIRTARRFLWLQDHVTDAARDLAISDPIPAPRGLTDGIRFEGVTFRYPQTDRDILADVDLRIPAGATVAVVGENGAGKSTLVKLLSRFYEPTAGRITVDGVDLSRIDPAEWRSVLAAGFQDFAKFEFLAQETVGIGEVGRMDQTDVVSEALSRARASDVVDALPDGLATQLGRQFNGGVELSGGQWQKLALGRAMMRAGPLVLLLDEPTAALDAQTEHDLFEQFAGAARRAAAHSGAVTLLVSHRFSTVRMADLILVMGDGRITESGTHEELMALGGTYADLYELQARAYR